MRKIDVFTHIFPAAYAERMGEVAPGFKDAGKRVRGVPMLVDLDERFRVMDRFEGYQQVLSLATPPIEVFATPPRRGRARAPRQRRHGGAGAEVSASGFPDSWRRCRSTIPTRRFAKRTGRSASLAPAAFRSSRTSAASRSSLPEFLPLFDAMAGFDLPIWLHPYRGADFPDYATEDRSQYEIWWTFGWPYETSVAMARMVFAGLFDKLPER